MLLQPTNPIPRFACYIWQAALPVIAANPGVCLQLSAFFWPIYNSGRPSRRGSPVELLLRSGLLLQMAYFSISFSIDRSSQLALVIAHCSIRQPILRLSVLAFRHTSRTCLRGRAACMTSAVTADQFHPPFTGPIPQAALLSLLLWWTQGFACTTRFLSRLPALFSPLGLTIVARIPKFFTRRHLLFTTISRFPPFHSAAILDSL